MDKADGIMEANSGEEMEETYGVLPKRLKIDGTNRTTQAKLEDQMKEIIRLFPKCGIIDKADKTLEANFGKEIKESIGISSKKRRTSLFSNTQTTKIAECARLSSHGPPVTNEGVLCYISPSAKRLYYLFKFLARKKSQKVMVFCSSGHSAKFHSELFKTYGMNCYHIRKMQKQERQRRIFTKFCEARKGVLFCSNAVNHDFRNPDVDWIVQYDPPSDPMEYIHRVCSAAHGEGAKGKPLLFLLPEEVKFLSYLEAANTRIKKYRRVKRSMSRKDQSFLEQRVATNYHVNCVAVLAYRGYILAYKSHPMKDIFNANHLNRSVVASSFGLISSSKRNGKEEEKKRAGG